MTKQPFLQELRHEAEMATAGAWERKIEWDGEKWHTRVYSGDILILEVPNNKYQFPNARHIALANPQTLEWLLLVMDGMLGTLSDLKCHEKWKHILDQGPNPQTKEVHGG